MTNVLIDLAMVGLLLAGLERNRARQGWPRPRLSGSTDAEDRDRARIQAELRAVQST